MTTIKRRPENPRARYLEIERAIIASAEAGAPISVRHVYYELIAAGIIEKNRSNYVRVVDIATCARRAGLIPFWHIADETRNAGGEPWSPVEPPAAWAEVEEVDLMIHGYEYSPPIWQYTDPPLHLECWTETRGMAAALAPVCRRHGVGVTAAGGMPSVSLIYRAVRRIRESHGRDNPTIIYVGDADRHGFKIQDFIAADFRETHDMPINLVRLAITPEEAEVRGDPNAEVIPIQTMRERLDAAIVDMIGDAPERRRVGIEAHYERVSAYANMVRANEEIQRLVAEANEHVHRANATLHEFNRNLT